LSMKDFESVHVDPTLSVLDKFLVVARVASMKFEQQKEENKPKKNQKKSKKEEKITVGDRRRGRSKIWPPSFQTTGLV